MKQIQLPLIGGFFKKLYFIGFIILFLERITFKSSKAEVGDLCYKKPVNPLVAFT